MSDVLLTYSWVRSSYAALRNLRKHGVSVLASDSHHTGMCQWSRFSDGFVRYTSHYEDEEEFVSCIERACDEKSVRLLFPSHNETEVLARHRSRFPANVGRLLPDPVTCALFNDKARSYDLAKRLGVPVPLRVDYDEPNDVAARIREAGLEKVVVKLRTGNSSKGVFYPDSPQQAQRLVLDLVRDFSLTPERQPQIEERVEGSGVGFSVLYWDGKPVAEFGHIRLREKIATGGTSTLRKGFANDAVRNAAHRLFQGVAWHGLAMAEFKYCPESGRVWFIEVNPRMWGSIALPIASGVEFPYLAWLCATEGPDAAIAFDRRTEKKEGWRCRWLLGDWLLSANLALHGDFAAAGRTIFSRSDSFDDFHWDDPGAFAGEVANYVSRVAVSRSINPSEPGMVR